ncbi:hypothetical protein HaLaN_14307, partial [Haematococcus lacustris]
PYSTTFMNQPHHLAGCPGLQGAPEVPGEGACGSACGQRGGSGRRQPHRHPHHTAQGQLRRSSAGHCTAQGQRHTGRGSQGQPPAAPPAAA